MRDQGHVDCLLHELKEFDIQGMAKGPAAARAGGHYATAGRDASILLRMKEDQDNAEPAASSVALANLARLAALAAPGSVPCASPGHHCRP